MNPMRPSSRLNVLVLAVLPVLCAGCAQTLKIHVNSTAETNKGQILYMMVRATDDEALIAEDYATAASRVFTPSAEPLEQKVQAILPGKSINLSMPRPAKQRLALYFFFAQPGKHWMTPIDPPIPAEIFVDLGNHEIKGVQVRRQ
jgi:hypothetical protein